MHCIQAGGLSPRLRGNRRGGDALYPSRGSIPAPAGEPPKVPGQESPMRSIPAPAGNPNGAVGLWPQRRSIPAPAGEPREPSPGPAGIPVYPRACGGTSTQRMRLAVSVGLSPRLRGNRVFTFDEEHKQGSIPAPAGEPLIATCIDGPDKVYPRACGGTYGVSGRQLSPLGSIPAPAGEPHDEPFPVDGHGVYPRACGGTVIAHRFGCAPQGLSPRLRGNRLRELWTQ